MTTLAICAALFLGSNCTINEGWSSRYDETPMMATIELRQEWEQLPLDLSAYDGFAAVADCGRIGSETWIAPAGGEFHRILIVDCAGAASTYAWMTDNDILVEIDPWLAAAWGAVDVSVPLTEVRP